jgi:hypothetical protein
LQTQLALVAQETEDIDLPHDTVVKGVK